jgi:hypothetical protein
MSQGQTTLVELSEALQDFAASPRFNFLKTLQVGRFVESAPLSLGILGEFTFEKLVELGTKKIAKLKWLSKEQEALLITLLRALGEEDGGELFQPPSPISPAVRESTEEADQEDSSEELLSSAQVEIDLRNRLQAVRRSPDFETLRFRSLGQFWDPSWPRAPFEESFTLEQLTELDMSTLFRKRTMTSSRIRYMTKALDRALGPDEGDGKEESRAAHVVADSLLEEPTSHLPAQPAATSISVSWRQPPTRAGSVEAAVLEYFLDACSVAHASSHPLERALSALPPYLSGDQFISLLDSGPLDKAIGIAVRKWLVHADTQGSARALSLMLQGLGISLNALAEMFAGESFRGATALIGLQAYARILGAEEVSISGSVCKGVWSLNPELLRVVVGRLGSSRGQRAIDTLNRLVPVMDPILHKWLCSVLQPQKRKRSPRKVSRTRKR